MKFEEISSGGVIGGIPSLGMVGRNMREREKKDLGQRKRKL